MKKLSIIRFKPKPECFEEFLENLQAYSREAATADPPTHFLMLDGGEIYTSVVRDAEVLQESVSKGVEWLDDQRHLLQEYNKVDRHTPRVSGDFVEY